MKQDLRSLARRLPGTAAVLVALSMPALFTSTTHAQPVAPALCEELEHHGSLASLPDNVSVLQLVFRLETPTAGATGRLVPNPGRLPIAPETIPAEVRAKPGYYVGVTSASEPTRYSYLARLADPSYIVAEAVEKDEFSAEVVRRPGGVLATRVPFLAGGRLIICDAMTGQRKVLAAHPLGPAPFPPQGKDFKGYP